MAGVVETSWSLGDIDRAIAGSAALAFLRTVGTGHGPDLENVGISAFPCAGTRNNAWIRAPLFGHPRAQGLAKVHGSGHGSNVKMLRLKELQ